jgi:hypothetical protein
LPYLPCRVLSFISFIHSTRRVTEEGYLLTQGDECFLTAQVLVELWVVATRPVEVNGLGWAVNTVRISPKTCKLTNVPLDDFVAHADATVFVEFS